MTKGSLIGLKDSFPASMRGWSNEDSIFENENLKCHFIFMFSGLKLGVYGLILVLKIFANVSRYFFPFRQLNMAQLCVIVEFLPGHILQMVILAKNPEKVELYGRV